MRTIGLGSTGSPDAVVLVDCFRDWTLLVYAIRPLASDEPIVAVWPAAPLFSPSTLTHLAPWLDVSTLGCSGHSALSGDLDNKALTMKDEEEDELALSCLHAERPAEMPWARWLLLRAVRGLYWSERTQSNQDEVDAVHSLARGLFEPGSGLDESAQRQIVRVCLCSEALYASGHQREWYQRYVLPIIVTGFVMAGADDV